MDPNANLKEQLALAQEILDIWDRWDDDNLRFGVGRPLLVSDKASRLAELVQALDGWLSNGGSPPSRWDSHENQDEQ